VGSKIQIEGVVSNGIDTFDEADEQDKIYSVLFRATDGDSDKKKKIKLSTVVAPQDLDNFWISYTEVVKTGMSGLRKKEKKKKKAKAKKDKADKAK
jgi:signal recognition particle subunit SRP14